MVRRFEHNNTQEFLSDQTSTNFVEFCGDKMYLYSMEHVDNYIQSIILQYDTYKWHT